MNETLSEIKDAIQREDYDSAIRLLRPLADAGQSEAQFLFGYLFFTGADVTKDDSRVWLQRAASQDHPDAIYYLACLDDTLDFGPPEDDSRRALLVRLPNSDLRWPSAILAASMPPETKVSRRTRRLDASGIVVPLHRATPMPNTITALCCSTARAAQPTKGPVRI